MDGGLVYNIEFLCSTFYVKHHISDNLLKKIKSQLQFIKNNPNKKHWNQNLAGALEEQYHLDTDNNNFYEELEDLVLNICEDTERRQEVLNPGTRILEYNEVYLESAWINFQKKYEFNPIHTHSGDYSFVLFVDVPFSFEDENTHKNAIRTSEFDRSNAVFSFVYPDDASDIPITYQHLKVDKSWEGILLVFPARLAHCVNPFYTSDGNRVTISGNIFFDNTEDEE